MAKGEGARRGEGQEAEEEAEEERWGGRWLVLPLLGGRQVLEERNPMVLARLSMRSWCFFGVLVQSKGVVGRCVLGATTKGKQGKKHCRRK